MILAEWLMVETVADIHRRSSNPGSRSRYELLGIAPLLRKLLFDRKGLVDTVRAGRSEISIRFRMRAWCAPEGEQLPYVLRLGGSDLVGGPDDPALTTAQFSKTTVGQIDGRDLLVRDVVRYYAHVEGGVHFGSPKEPGQATLSNMAPLLLGQTTGQIEILAHLGSIVVGALEPLCESILASPTIDSRLHHLNENGWYDGHWTAEHRS